MDATRTPPLEGPRPGRLLLVKATVGLTVQDGGRCGRMHEGVPPGGPLVPELLAAANGALGNAPETAGIELFLGSARLRAVGGLTCALDGAVHVLADGDELDLPATAEAVRYLALTGGVDVPVQLGARGTLTVARVGGLEGRMLRTGDVLAAGALPTLVRETPFPAADFDAPIRLVRGPDAFPAETLARLVALEFRVARALDRTGMRLDGEKLPPLGDRPFSTPMVRGAIQLTSDGTPIVLGPDHPTTGGYPVLATVLTGDLGRLARRRPGAPVRFVFA